MHPHTLTISTKKLDTKVNYHNPTKTFQLDDARELELDFLVERLQKEVKEVPTPKLKEWKKTCKRILTSASAMLLIATPAMAQTTAGVPALLPSDILQVGLYLMGILVATSFVLAMVLYQLAAGSRMFGKKKESSEWINNIIKGYTQVLIGPVIIVAITLVMILLFGSFEWFVKPL